MKAFGPVPSRRLGRSLGINNIPPKICTYACVYCQLGSTAKMQIERQAFYPPEAVLADVAAKCEQAAAVGETIDYLTIVPDGEPTLDSGLGRLIGLLKPLGIKIAIISNASLIWRDDVRDDLLGADWVSLKFDAVQEAAWHRVDRPHGKLQLPAILQGAQTFAAQFTGELVTETMLVRGVNDSAPEVTATADFLAQLAPAQSYLGIPTRPPAESWVQPPDEAALIAAFQRFAERLDHVEYLIGYEGNEFALTGDVAEDLLSITAVHPMRRDAVEALLTRAGAEWDVVTQLITQNRLVKLDYDAQAFYMRALPTQRR